MSSFALRPVSFNPAPAPKSRKRRHPRPRPKPIPRPRPAGNPRNDWPAWCDERWTITEARDLAEVPAFVPTPAAEAYDLGFRLGYEHDRTAGPDSSLSPALALSWRAGYSAGFIARHDDEDEIERLQDDWSNPPGEIRETDGYTPGYYS